jgi:hypothetical protein
LRCGQGCIHLLEPERRPASQRVGYILGTDFVVAKHRPPERPDGAGRGRIDGYLDMLHAARVGIIATDSNRR